MLTLREALQNAATSHMALGHFNVSDLSGFHAVVRAGRRLNLPLMIGVSEGEREFIGLKEIALLVRIAREEYGVSLYLNADHTHSLEKARAAAEAGFDEVIFDASVKSFEQNIHETRQAVEILKSIRPDLIVEGEVGYIGASSEIVESVPVESLKLTTPQEAAQFVAETKVDVLAPADRQYAWSTGVYGPRRDPQAPRYRTNPADQAGHRGFPDAARRLGDCKCRFPCRD